jgi:hypothetical protein
MKLSIYLFIFLLIININLFSQELPTVNPGEDIQKSIEDDLPAELSEEKSKQISRYFEEALKNYEDILSSERSSEVRTTSQRLEKNIQLLEEHKSKLGQSETGLRKLKLEYVRRFLILKNAYTQGKFTQKMYEDELDRLGREYQAEVNTLMGDTKFYQGEVNKTQKTIAELEEYQRVNNIFLEKEELEKGYNPAPAKKLSPLEGLISSMHKVPGCFEIRNYASSLEFK